MERAICAAGAAAVLLLAASPASAQPQCLGHDEVVAGLEGQFKERRKAIGLTAQGQLVEMFAAEDGPWTMVVTSPDQMSCIAFHGSNWYRATDEAEAGGNPTGPAPGAAARKRPAALAR